MRSHQLVFSNDCDCHFPDFTETILMIRITIKNVIPPLLTPTPTHKYSLRGCDSSRNSVTELIWEGY